MSKRSLRDYQERAIHDLRAALRSGSKRPVLQLPTGAGKTRLAGEIIRMATEKGNRAMFVVPAVSLVDQTVQSFWNDGIQDIGVIQANHPMTDYSKPVQVASAQTLARRQAQDGFGLVLVDECHMQNQALLKWIASDEMKKTPVIGLSATPWAKGMAKHWDALIIANTTARMIADGYLSHYRVYAPGTPDLSKVKTVAGDYKQDDLAEVMGDAKLVGDIVSHWLAHGNNEPTLCFCVDRAHARKVQARFESAGIPCGYIDAYTTREQREEMGKAFHRGDYKVICNVGTLTTGVDWIVRCIILARPTKSEMLFTQIMGRGLRPEYAGGYDLSTVDGRLQAIANGPKAGGCIILDHAGVHTGTADSLGFVEDIHYDELDDGTPKGPKEKKRKEALPKECPSCQNMKPPKTPKCPFCGHKTEAPVSEIEEAQASLTEIVRGKGTKSGGPKNHIRIKDEWIPNERFYGMLKWTAKWNGYKLGWAAYQYKEALGVWPNKYKEAPEIEPNLAVMQWVKNQRAKSNANRR